MDERVATPLRSSFTAATGMGQESQTSNIGFKRVRKKGLSLRSLLGSAISTKDAMRDTRSIQTLSTAAVLIGERNER